MEGKVVTQKMMRFTSEDNYEVEELLHTFNVVVNKDIYILKDDYELVLNDIYCLCDEYLGKAICIKTKEEFNHYFNSIIALYTREGIIKELEELPLIDNNEADNHYILLLQKEEYYDYLF